MPEASDSAAETGDLIGEVIADRYLIEALLGEGGMGAVYKARHVHMHKPVAIKVLHREMTLNDEARIRFEREAVASARIEHPHVTGATDFGKLDDGTCYLVLDYVSGQSLKKVLANEAPLGAARTVHIVRQIAVALEAAHGAGVIHRDLKPDNVMLIEHKGEADFVKVLDFGIAKLQSRNSGHTVQLTQAGAVFGTPEYMSPEQAAGNVVDARADLYTIGIMLYEMLAGETPFKGETIVAILTQHLTVEAPDLPEHVHPGLRRIVRKLLQKDPELRFQTATELLEALDGIEAPETARTIPAPALADATTAPPTLGSRAAQVWRGTLQPTLGRVGQTPLSVRGRTLPLWQLAAACTALGVLLAVLLWPSADEQAPPEAASTSEPAEGPAKPTPPKKSLGAPRIDLARVRSGDAAALAALAARPPSTRGASEWAALVVGRFRAGDPAASLDAFDEALAAKRRLTKEPEVLEVVAALALERATSQAALSHLGEHFGERGADRLYAWSKTAPPGVDASFSTRVEKALAAARQPSPALELALDLDVAKTCAAVRDLLPRAKSHADDRASAALQKKTARRGCGMFNLGDCFKCLRGDNALNEAIAAAKSRPAPEVVEPLEAPAKTVPASSR